MVGIIRSEVIVMKKSGSPAKRRPPCVENLPAWDGFFYSPMVCSILVDLLKDLLKGHGVFLYSFVMSPQIQVKSVDIIEVTASPKRIVRVQSNKGTAVEIIGTGTVAIQPSPKFCDQQFWPRW